MIVRSLARSTARNQEGFSLVEVIVALGLLGGVLISVAGLFVLGGRQVKSGKTATEALSVARGILEQMNGWGFHQVYTLLGSDGSTVSFTADTRTIDEDSMEKWQPLLDEKLLNSYAEIEVTSLSSGAAPNLDATKSIRIVVTVHWDEGRRPRTLQVATVRM